MHERGLHQRGVSARAVTAAIATSALTVTLLGACSSESVDLPPPTIEPARAALSPPASVPPTGQVLPLAGKSVAAAFDSATKSLAVLTTPEPDGGATVTIFGPAGPPRVVAIPAAASAITGDGNGVAHLSARGAVISVELASGAVTRRAVEDRADTDFTAIARRADGRLVLGTADGKACTLGPMSAAADLRITHTAAIFARVDAIVTVGDSAVVLDRSQTSVTELDDDGEPGLALRAGQGATGIAADAAGRVLVTDTRAGQLMVFGVDPLIERQAYPVAGSPYGVAGSRRLAWVSQTATNTVVGYDLSTGTPVEKVRYPTVQQPDTLAFDDAGGTLYVVSASGAGVQVIRDAGMHP